MANPNLEVLRAKRQAAERKGNVITQTMATNFPKPPPAGMAYSKNFARCLKDGRFAIQTRD